MNRIANQATITAKNAPITEEEQDDEVGDGEEPLDEREEPVEVAFDVVRIVDVEVDALLLDR